MSCAPALEAELITAMGRARYPNSRVHAMLAPLGLPLGFAPLSMSGIGTVEFFRSGRATYYQPAEDGRWAVIIAVTETLFSRNNEPIGGIDLATGIDLRSSEPAGSEIVDLCAVDLETQRVGLRLGIGKALGLDAIDHVRFHGGVLHLVDQPFDWLRQPVEAALIIDWASAALTLADLERPVTTLADQPIEVCCSSLALAERVERAFRRPLPIPSLTVAV